MLILRHIISQRKVKHEAENLLQIGLETFSGAQL